MTAYECLNRDLERLLKRTARFVKVAFHVHSPYSHDWGQRPGADKDRNRKDKFLAVGGEKLFLDELAKQFDIVCVTDHMKTSYACRLARAAASRGDILVFPGIEVNCKIPPNEMDHVHVLVIFPPSCGETVIDRIFSRGNLPGESDRTGDEVFTIPDSMREWVSRVKAEGGIVIPAHIDNKTLGHRAYFRSTRHESLEMFTVDETEGVVKELAKKVSEEYKSCAVASGFDALEIRNPEDQQHYVSFTTSTGERGRMPCVIRSDFHSIESFGSEDCTTYVKVSRRDFTCVRDALRFFETRIKFKHDLPSTPSPRIIGIRLRSPSGEGFLRDATIAFNENLNCIIGPRGCGKSTIIEAIRYVLACNPVLQENGTRGEDDSDYRSLALGIQRANLVDTIIELVYETTAGERHCLSAAYDPKASVTTEVYEMSGDLRPVTHEAIPIEYPARIFSWSEIENLGRRPELQRHLLDRLIKELPALLNRRDEVYHALARNRNLIENACSSLAEKLREDNSLLTRYAEFKSDFERVNTEEVSALFADLDLSREKLQFLRKVKEQLESVSQKGQEVASTQVAGVVAGLLATATDALHQWWDSEVSGLLSVSDVDKTLLDLASQVEKSITERLAVIDALAFGEAELLRANEAELRERTQASPDEDLRRLRREQRKRRYDEAMSKRNEYLELWAKFQGLLADRARLVQNLNDIQDEISQARAREQKGLNETVNALTGPGFQITIGFRQGKDCTEAVKFMRDNGFLQNGPIPRYRQQRIAERCCEMANPTRIARAFLEGDKYVFLEQGSCFDTEETLSDDDATRLVEFYHPFSYHEGADVDVVDIVKLCKIMQLQETRWDDELRILLNGRPVDEESPGRRSSAMLPLVLLSENVPLIIDQPEDNLDNQLLGSVLAGIFAHLKERRQLIVATHNPNIVVGGDAEQVIVLDTVGRRQGSVVASASIDDPDIIAKVIQILEGGKEAFEARNRRYKPYL